MDGRVAIPRADHVLNIGLRGTAREVRLQRPYADLGTRAFLVSDVRFGVNAVTHAQNSKTGRATRLEGGNMLNSKGCSGTHVGDKLFDVVLDFLSDRPGRLFAIDEI